MASSKILSNLRKRAREAAQHAYCPYSDFRVGAAILCTDGSIFAGCNVENASYGLTVCAERSAICHMVAGGQREFQAVAIYTPTTSPTSPCGACRQVLFEFGPGAKVIACCDSGEEIITTVAKLLPGAFGPVTLKENDE